MLSEDNETLGTRKLKPLALTAEQVAQLLGISVRSVWRFASTGELPHPISIGRSKRWDVREIEDFLRRKTAGNPSSADDLGRCERYPDPASRSDRDCKDRSA